jgi:hypothetical protein
MSTFQNKATFRHVYLRLRAFLDCKKVAIGFTSSNMRILEDPFTSEAILTGENHFKVSRNCSKASQKM